MTTPPFPEFAQITEALAQVAGEARGMVAAGEALPKKIAGLGARLERAVSQVEMVNTEAAAMAQRARDHPGVSA